MKPRTQAAITAAVCWAAMILGYTGVATYHGHGLEVLRFFAIVGGALTAIVLVEVFYPWREK